jgi:hypothetical protein
MGEDKDEALRCLLSDCDSILGRSGYVRRRSVAKRSQFRVLLRKVRLVHFLFSDPFLVIMCNTTVIIYTCPFI